MILISKLFQLEEMLGLQMVEILMKMGFKIGIVNKQFAELILKLNKQVQLNYRFF